MANAQVLGLLGLVAGFILTGVSFVVPYWLRNDSWKEESGLWGVCYQKPDLFRDYWWRSCQWFFEDDFAWESHLPGWWKACQVILSLTIILLLATFLLACVNLCCPNQKHGDMSFPLAVLVFICFFLISCTLGVFGGYAESDFEVDLYGNYTYRWGFYVCSSALLPLLFSSICYLIAGFLARSSWNSNPYSKPPGYQY